MNITDTNPFRSFWMGGYECTDQLNVHGERIDLLNTTRHLQNINSDYQQLSFFNIATVREGIRWSFVEKQAYVYDFSTVKAMLKSGRENGIQQIWDICHFGFPDDLTPLHPHFAKRFTALCVAFVKFYRQECPGETLIVTPINEVSFISWLGGETRGTAPYACGMGWHVKYELMKAYIKAIYAMKEVDPNVRILTTEPIVNIVPPIDAGEDEIATAAATHQDQFQAVDMLAGYMCPELGGSPELLDILGFNFYYNNQWVLGFGEFLPWFNENNDPRWKPLSDLLTDAYNRYHRPMVITETSHSGEHRPNWIEFIGKQCADVIAKDLPLWGVCLYPIIDRPDWDDLNYWHTSGLWDEAFLPDGSRVRELHVPYAEALLQAQLVVNKASAPVNDALVK